MARTRTSPVPAHTNESQPFQETSFSSIANTSSGNRALDRIQRHPSPGPETSDSLFFATNSQGHPHIQGPQNHVHHDSSSSSVAGTPPLIVDFTVSNPSSNGVNHLDGLPSKPTIPVELMTQVDQKIPGYLETFHSRSQRLFDEQKATSEFTKEQISLVAQQCIDLQAIIELRKEVRKLKHCCPYCKDLAWDPHMIFHCPLKGLRQTWTLYYLLYILSPGRISPSLRINATPDNP
ncbi:hypothetical protein F5879DRAFT_924224 [Lentinula edodes]|nr:hypothetical protein F5879DRAFT_924224 [Lentinula edodes]